MATKPTKTPRPARTRSERTVAPPAGPVRPTVSLSRANGVWLGAAAAAIAIGYALLARGDTGVAPVLLVLGYCVLLPIGIIKK